MDIVEKTAWVFTAGYLLGLIIFILWIYFKGD